MLKDFFGFFFDFRVSLARFPRLYGFSRKKGGEGLQSQTTSHHGGWTPGWNPKNSDYFGIRTSGARQRSAFEVAARPLDRTRDDSGGVFDVRY